MFVFCTIVLKSISEYENTKHIFIFLSCQSYEHLVMWYILYIYVCILIRILVVILKHFSIIHVLKFCWCFVAWCRYRFWFCCDFIAWCRSPVLLRILTRCNLYCSSWTHCLRTLGGVHNTTPKICLCRTCTVVVSYHNRYNRHRMISPIRYHFVYT